MENRKKRIRILLWILAIIMTCCVIPHVIMARTYGPFTNNGLCIILGHNPITDPLCATNEFFPVLEHSFQVGETTRQEVRRKLWLYYMEPIERIDEDTGEWSVVDVYKLHFSLLDGQAFFEFDENEILIDIKFYH